MLPVIRYVRATGQLHHASVASDSVEAHAHFAILVLLIFQCKTTKDDTLLLFCTANTDATPGVKGATTKRKCRKKVRYPISNTPHLYRPYFRKSDGLYVFF